MAGGGGIEVEQGVQRQAVEGFRLQRVQPRAPQMLAMARCIATDIMPQQRIAQPATLLCARGAFNPDHVPHENVRCPNRATGNTS